MRCMKVVLPEPAMPTQTMAMGSSVGGEEAILVVERRQLSMCVRVVESSIQHYSRRRGTMQSEAFLCSLCPYRWKYTYEVLFRDRWRDSGARTRT
jgi:hypothetical protein